MLDGDATTRSEWKIVALPVVLQEVERHVVGLDGGTPRDRADRELGHLVSRRDITFHQDRRQRQHLGVVVETVLVWRVRGNQLGDIDIEVEQVTDNIAILGLIEAMKSLGPSRVDSTLSRLVEFGLEP